MEEDTCPVCQADAETSNHLILACPFAGDHRCVGFLALPVFFKYVNPLVTMDVLLYYAPFPPGVTLNMLNIVIE